MSRRSRRLRRAFDGKTFTWVAGREGARHATINVQVVVNAELLEDAVLDPHYVADIIATDAATAIRRAVKERIERHARD